MTVLAQLNHPNIVALLGVSIHPMCMVIEFALMGSLFDTLDNLTVEQIKQDQADRASVILSMPWRWSTGHGDHNEDCTTG